MKWGRDITTVDLLKFIVSLVAWAIISTYTIGRSVATVTVQLQELKAQTERIELRLDRHIDSPTTFKPGGMTRNAQTKDY